MNAFSRLEIIDKTETPIARRTVSCVDCMLHGSCFPTDMGAPEVSDFDSMVHRARPLHKGDHVYRTEQPFTTVYAVRSGAFKAYAISSDGEEQVIQFYLPGEIFGVDGLSRNRHAMSVVALETSAVCAIPFERLQALSMRTPGLQRHFFRLMSETILREQELITQLGKFAAERRIAAFLQRIAEHQAGRRQSATRLRLPMTRTDISSHLGLTVETVSRIFGRLQKLGLIAADNREIEILSPEALRQLADGKAPLRQCGAVVAIPRRQPAIGRRNDRMDGTPAAAVV